MVCAPRLGRCGTPHLRGEAERGHLGHGLCPQRRVAQCGTLRRAGGACACPPHGRSTFIATCVASDDGVTVSSTREALFFSLPDVKHTTAVPSGEGTRSLAHSLWGCGRHASPSIPACGWPCSRRMRPTAPCATSAPQSSVASGCSRSTAAPPQRSRERAASAELQRALRGASTAPTAVTANSASSRHLCGWRSV
jgi:hypothetical protein